MTRRNMSSMKGLSPQKEWGRECYKGMENMLMPSFSADFSEIDEAGVRLDVQNSIRHGFFSMLMMPIGIDRDTEKKRFVKTVCDEAGDDILVGSIIANQTLEVELELIRFAEASGVSQLFIWPTLSLAKARTEEEAYQAYLSRIETTELPVVLYANFSSFANIGFSLNVFKRLAKLPNVIAIKLTQPMNLVTAFQVCEQLGDQLLIGPVNLDLLPILSKHYGVQWSGQWNVEAVQSPASPFAVQLVTFLNEGRYNDALDVYRQMEPLLNDFFEFQAPLIKQGGHPWAHMKYFQWCGGGNGGLIKGTDTPGNHVPVLDQAARMKIRASYEQVGIKPSDSPEDSFLVGRKAFARGVSAPDLSQTPSYRTDNI